MPIISGGGGGPAAGSYLPVANASGVTVDTTTYNDTIKGSGKLTTLVFPADQGALAIAVAGDVYPRWVLGANASDFGLCAGDGTIDAPNKGGFLLAGAAVGGFGDITATSYRDTQVSPALTQSGAPQLQQVSPKFVITSAALPTVALVSGAAAQISTSRDAETVTPFTGDGTNNAATCAIALSPDNVTFSLLDTLSIAAAVNLTGVLALSVNVRVPAGWYLKLTAVHGTIGTTTYY